MGLSPAENREIPPLRYDAVYRLKQELPALEVVINGGVATLDEADSHLDRVDGAMIGRAAYADPAMLRAADRRIFGAPPQGLPSRHDIARAMLPYAFAGAVRRACRSTTSRGTCSGSSRAGRVGAPGAARSAAAAITPTPAPRSSRRRSRWCRSAPRPGMPGAPTLRRQ